MAEAISWIDADGNEILLSDQADLDILAGVQGRFAPPVAFASDVVPLQDGQRLRNVRYDVREVGLVLRARNADPVAFRERLRSLTYAFSPVRGDGRIRCYAPDGSQRELFCRYSSGMDLTEDMPHIQRAVVVFRAFDPFWYDAADNVETFTVNILPAFFPLFPLRLASTTVFASATVTNDGDVETWPVWTITGPGSGLVLRNLTTGQMISLSRTLASGEQVSIDARPFVKTIQSSDGSNLYPALSSDSALWPLHVGANAIQIELTAATGVSAVHLSYKRRYLAP